MKNFSRLAQNAALAGAKALIWRAPGQHCATLAFEG